MLKKTYILLFLVFLLRFGFVYGASEIHLVENGSTSAISGTPFSPSLPHSILSTHFKDGTLGSGTEATVTHGHDINIRIPMNQTLYLVCDARVHTLDYSATLTLDPGSKLRIIMPHTGLALTEGFLFSGEGGIATPSASNVYGTIDIISGLFYCPASLKKANFRIQTSGSNAFLNGAATIEAFFQLDFPLNIMPSSTIETINGTISGEGSLVIPTGTVTKMGCDFDKSFAGFIDWTTGADITMTYPVGSKGNMYLRSNYKYTLLNKGEIRYIKPIGTNNNCIFHASQSLTIHELDLTSAPMTISAASGVTVTIKKISDGSTNMLYGSGSSMTTSTIIIQKLPSGVIVANPSNNVLIDTK